MATGVGAGYLLRHALAIAVLPVTVAVVVPVWLARRNDVTLALGDGPGAVAMLVAGVGLAGVGLLLFVGSVGRFAAEGRGTLAPWDPPRELVISGPYRHVRNPMISGVTLMLFGEALVLRSRAHLLWACLFLAANALYIPLVEEPALARRFGDGYREYCRQVPRLIPRLKP
ncbi:MAG TPA: isoprenylcysteine carboxylmethyltransferase family protein [Gemmatimonadales bacterium]|jgi:protein-S-isoprenylcysteine O-methyltransferase Ste14|nr:isoprenylcysteine carboxylmethyltransferase family protein [Gemmatimonadales bacterium]